MSRQKSPAAIGRPSATRAFTVDDIDRFNDDIRYARGLLILALHTLEPDGVLITKNGEDDMDGLTSAVCGALTGARDRLIELHAYINGQWEKGGA